MEECIWGRLDWDSYAKKLVTAESFDERALLQRIEVVKGNVGRQIRKAVEQHHPRLVEQASALHGLDLVQAAISREMSHLFVTSEQLCSRFSAGYEDLRSETLSLEQLYALRRLLFAANRCEQLVRRLCSVGELVKHSEMISELEAVVAETPLLKEVVWMREALVVTIPKLIAEAHQSTVKQLKSSLETLHAPLVSSCARALQNLSCYDAEINNLIDENVKTMDAQFLQLSTKPESAAKLLPHITSQVQALLEQFSLLGTEVSTSFCSRLAQTITNRIPENAPYACRILQLFSRTLSQLPISVVQPIYNALQPMKTALLSQSLSRMFSAVNAAMDDPVLRSSVVEKICSIIREELLSVEWDPDLRREMEVNVSKTIELTAQKIEQRLSLDEKSLHMGERISSVQALNYSLINVAYSLSAAWPHLSSPLARTAEQARDAIMRVGLSSVATILLSMHKEELGCPSPYAKELCEYLNSFRLHISAFSPFASSDGALSVFIDQVIELFLMNASLLRPTSREHLTNLAHDFRHIARTALVSFNAPSQLLDSVQDFADALTMSPEELAHTELLPFWTAVQLLISQSEASLLSPHASAGWTLSDYIDWFLQQSAADRLHFLSSLMGSYTSSVISSNCTEYVSNYPFIMDILKKAAMDR